MSVATKAVEVHRVLDESGNVMFEVERWAFVTLAHGDHFPERVVELGVICLTDSEARRAAEVLEAFAGGEEVATGVLYTGAGELGGQPMFGVETWSFGNDYLTLVPQEGFFGERWTAEFLGGYHFTRTEAGSLAQALRDVLD